MYLKILKCIGLCLVFGFGSYVATTVITNIPAASALTRNEYQNNLSQTISRIADLNFRTLGFQDLKFKKDNDTNLYLILFNEFAEKSRTNGIALLAGMTGYSDSNIRDLVDNYDTKFLSQKKDSTPESVSIRANEIIRTYQQEKGLFATLAALEGQTLAFELFANGKSRDSGFDLVEDLDEIEIILLGRNVESQFSGSLNLETSGAEVLAGSSFSLSNNSNNTGNDDDDDDDDAPPPEPDATADSDSTMPKPNQISCPIDSSLTEDLKSFTEEQEARLSEPTTPEEQQKKDAEQKLINKITQGGIPNSNPLVNNVNKCDIPEDFTGVKFCIKVEKVYATARSYFARDLNCVACRIQNLANITKELVAGSLIPKKVSGNFGEPNLCKKSLFNSFSLQINFVPKPARPDLEVVDSITDISTVEIARQIQARTLQLDSTDSFTAADSTGQGLIGTTQIQGSPNEILQSEIDILNIESASSAAINSTSEFVSEIIDRLTTMNQYFSNYKTYLAEIQSNLTELKSKPQCSAL